MADTDVTLELTRSGSENRLFWWGDSWTDYIVLSSTNLTDWQTNGIMSGDGAEKGAYAYVTNSSAPQMYFKVKKGRSLPFANFTLDPTSPQTEIVQISTTHTTPHVPLAIFDVRMSRAAGTIHTFAVTMKSTKANVADLLQNIKLDCGGIIYSAAFVGLPDENGTNVTVVFSNMNVTAPPDYFVPIAIRADVAQSTDHMFDGASVTVSLNVWGRPENDTTNRHTPDITDDSFNPVSVAEGYVVGATQIYSAGAASLVRDCATLNSMVVSNGVTIYYGVSFTATIAAADQTVYIPSDLFSSGIVVGPGGVLSPGNMTAYPTILAGDSNTSSANGYYVIPAGATRQFTAHWNLSSAGNAPGERTAEVWWISYGTSSSNLSEFDLNTDHPKVTAQF